MKEKKFKITKTQQLKELNSRIPPIVNVDIVVTKDDKYLIGKRSRYGISQFAGIGWLFPGGRMKYTETPQETAERILKTETPGIQATLKKLITVISDQGTDYRAYGITIYYLYEYKSGTPKPNKQLEAFKWVTGDELLDMPRAYSLSKSIVNEIDTTIRTMNTTQDELIVEVDSNNKDIGTIIKRDAHSNPSIYHRSAMIAIFNSKGETILQKRSMTKAQAPGFWDLAGGHQVPGQTIEQTAQAELSEELGITSKLKLATIKLYRGKEQSEFQHIFYGISDGPYGFDRNEVEAIKAFDCEKLLSGQYDQEYKILPHVHEFIEELKTVWEPLQQNNQ